ncbi:septation protein IspZ [Patescibacteria group bacterium]|nr:septation protein IspZ [Patescibacteria group bacterium]
MLKTIFFLFLEILPLLLFFTLGQYLPFLQAVAGYMFATIAVTGIIWHLQKRISYLALIFGGYIIITGSLSIWFSNPTILLLSDTLYYGVAALGMALLSLLKINVLKKLFGHTFAITDTGWRILNRRWMIVLALAGIGNELVRQLGTTDDWLYFQVIRTFLIIVFATYQFTLTRKHRLPHATAWGVAVTK